MHPKLYEQVKNILIDNGIDANKYAVSHFDVIKTESEYLVIMNLMNLSSGQRKFKFHMAQSYMN